MHNVLQMSPEARRLYERVRPAVETALAAGAPCDRLPFALRLERTFQNLIDGLTPVYGARPDFEAFVEKLCLRLAERWLERPDDLKALDFERDLTPDWFQRERMLGYVAYVERFAGTLRGVEEHLDYLAELGVTYLHLMSVLRPRPGPNDGGYAVVDYRAVDPAIGDIDDLESLCRSLRRRGVSVCIDLVLNHCAREHEWARRARAGDAEYQEFFYLFEGRELPDAYERTLPEVFPDMAPGSFSYDPESDRWVWTTFYDFQWDLNWTNPRVFAEIVDIMLELANRGVEVFRLDAVAFMWKRLGTDCQNQPEVHDLLQALRACSKIAAAATIHKAEAIVAPDDLIHYLGSGRHHGKVSNLAYHNSLMVQFWSSLASRDTRLMTHALREFPRTPNSIAWGTYIRCHDDIGWAVADDDAIAVGLDGPSHRVFLSDYYSGAFPGSHARGEVFGYNPRTGDRRISGTFASLAGLEEALEEGDERRIALAIDRILLGHALICGFGGIPLIYMGDELGLRNDRSYLADPERAGDNRWLHRPPMDWAAADRRRLAGSVEARLYRGLQEIVRARRATPQLHAAVPTEVLDIGRSHLWAARRPHPLGTLLTIYNFSETVQHLSAETLHLGALGRPYDRLADAPLEVGDGTLRMAPYGRLWLVGA